MPGLWSADPAARPQLDCRRGLKACRHDRGDDARHGSPIDSRTPATDTVHLAMADLSSSSLAACLRAKPCPGRWAQRGVSLVPCRRRQAAGSVRLAALQVCWSASRRHAPGRTRLVSGGLRRRPPPYQAAQSSVRRSRRSQPWTVPAIAPATQLTRSATARTTGADRRDAPPSSTGP